MGVAAATPYPKTLGRRGRAAQSRLETSISSIRWFESSARASVSERGPKSRVPNDIRHRWATREGFDAVGKIRVVRQVVIFVVGGVPVAESQHRPFGVPRG